MAFVKNIYAKKFNLGLKENTVAGQIATGEFSQEVKGSSLVIETPGKAVGVDYVEGTDISYSKLSNTTTTVALDQIKVFPYKIEAVDEWRTEPSLQNATSEQVAKGAAELIVTYILNNMATEGTGAIDLTGVTVTADNILEVLFEPLVAKFNELSVPTQDRKIVVNGSIGAMLLRADLLNRVEGIAGKAGGIGNTMGVDVFQSNLLPDKKLIALNPNAYAFGTGLNDITLFNKENITEFVGSAIRHLLNYGGKAVDGRTDEIIVISLA